jgi:Flp pilus assembly protein TadD
LTARVIDLGLMSRRIGTLVIIALALASGCAHELTARENALVLLSRGRTAEGIAELEKLRDAHPTDPIAWIDLGHGYELAHRYDDALEAYDHAADVAPKSPAGPREGGMRAAKWGETKAALPRLEEAVKRGDDEPLTFHALGIVRLSLGDEGGAKKAYQAGLATPKGAQDATCVLGLATLAVVRGDGTDALRWYDELAKRRPKVAGAQLGRAWALATLGRFDDADEALGEAASLGAKPEEVQKLRKWIAEERKKKGGSA